MKDKPVAIRISIVNDNRSISHSEWLQYNDKFKDLGILFEINDKGYLSMVMTPYNFMYIDMANWTAIGQESIEKEVCKNLSDCMEMHCYANTPLPSMYNAIDLYITSKSNRYYLDSECSNAALLIFTGLNSFHVELIDRITQSFKGRTRHNGDLLLIDCGRESHNTAIGRIRRIAALYLLQMGIPATANMITDHYIALPDNNDIANLFMYIY